MKMHELFKSPSSKEKNQEEPQLKGKALREALAEAASGAGMRPELVEKFLQFEEPESPVNVTRIASVLLVLHFASLTLVNLGVGANLDPTMQLPEWMHQSLQSIHNISVNAAESASIRHHFPFLLLEIGGVVGGGAVSEKLKDFRKKTNLALKIKGILEGQKEKGRINFKIQEGHSAVFSGNGDPYATWLQEMLGRDDAMTYTTNPDDDETLTKQGYELSSSRDTMDAAMERGDFINAGEVVLLPVTDEDQFLPEDDEESGSFDMSLSDMKVMISKMDDFIKKKLDSRDVEDLPEEKKKVIIVSSHNQTEIQKVGIAKTIKTTTLEQIVDSRNEKSEHLEIEIVDPTELVFDELMRLLDGKYPDFIAKGTSADRYTDRFYQKYKKRHADEEESEGEAALFKLQTHHREAVRVFYNVSDIDTVANASSSDIAIVSSERHKHVLIKDGVDPDRIIVISKLVQDKIDVLVHPEKQ